MAWAIGAATIGGALLNSNAASSAAGKQSEATAKAVGETKRESEQTRSDLAPYREAGQSALTRLRTLLGIPGGVDESDPRYQGIYKSILAEQDANHQKQFGMSMFDSRADVPVGFYDQWKQQARDRFQQQYGGEAGSSPDSGSLLKKFSTADLNADPVYNSGLQFGLDEGTKAIERRAAAGGGYDSGATLKALTRFGSDYGSTKAGESYGRFRDTQDATYGKLAGIAGMGSGATTVGVGANTATGTNLANLYTNQGNANAASTIAGSNAVTGGMNNLNQYLMLQQLQGGGARSLRPDTALTGANDLVGPG